MQEPEYVRLKEGLRVFIDPISMWNITRKDAKKPLPIRQSYWIRRALQKGILVPIGAKLGTPATVEFTKDVSAHLEVRRSKKRVKANGG
jgi:hypothetical protein